MSYVTYGVRELQANLGGALRAVEEGQRVLVTSRGKPVAVLVKATTRIRGESALEWKLRRLASEGKLILGQGGRIRPFKGFPLEGLSDQVIADRE
ncbi:MAG: type II toxin-antitoxin system prevent-host-death family antitoxin [Planctomycetes bacterium]|nr:type II toxin-antitoxin system prevent-host-death family antitoxin [Planctomycetota bacterium]